MYFTKRIKFVLIFLPAIFLIGCKKNKTDSSDFSSSVSSSKAFIWGGTVSHHSLADEYIDDFFKTLSCSRKIKTFFIICPSHFNLSTYDWSVANCFWNVENGNKVYTDLEKADKVIKYLDVDYDPQVFTIEHGISALTPFVSKYFPDAKIVAIAIKGEPPMNVEYAKKLYEAIQPYFTEKNRKDNFLLISSDFAHHGNEEQTRIKDERSALFFNHLSQENWILCGCDNRPGIFTLSRFINEKTKVIYLKHTNSFEIAGEGEDDITSYYFSLLGDI